MSAIRIRPYPTEKLDESIPRYWLAGSSVVTDLANALTILFPAGERFFVRSVRYYAKKIDDDPELQEAIRGFYGQEGMHAKAHDRQIEIMEQQGLKVQPFLEVYEKIAYDWIERVSPHELSLSTTVALEHFTAIMAEQLLKGDWKNVIHPAMERMLVWHACEEIEHRSVAFDVLKKVNPSYALRMKGLVMGTAVLGGFWLAGALYFRSQGVEPTERTTNDAHKSSATNNAKALSNFVPFARRVFVNGIGSYLKRDFDPRHRSDLDDLANKFIGEYDPEPVTTAHA